MPSNALTENHYRGINVISLWATAEEKAYTSPVWATYKQWSELGAQVRKGEKSALVIKYGEYEVSEAARLRHGVEDVRVQKGREHYSRPFS